MSGIMRQRANAISANSLRPAFPSRGKSPVVFAGHGAFYTKTDAKYPKVRLPPDVTLVFWCHHGETLSDTIAQFVEQQKPLSKLPQVLKEIAAAKSRGPFDGPTIPNRQDDLPEIVKGGSEIWNYRLTYPSGLILGSQPTGVKSSIYNPPVEPSSIGAKLHKYVKGVIRDDNYCIVPPISGGVQDNGVPIIAMLAGYWQICNNNVVHWCACRQIVDG